MCLRAKLLLLSTCSVVTLLGLGNGPAAGANFSLSGNLDFGNVLVNCAAIPGCIPAPSQNEMATRSGNSGSANISFGNGANPFFGDGSLSFPGGNKTTASESYIFAPTIAGAASQTITVISAQTKTFTLSGTGVAPIQSVSIANAAGTGGGTTNTGNLGNILVGSTAAATVTVANTGTGNTDTRQTPTVSNLNGTQSFDGSSAFTGASSSNFSLGDGASTSFTYTYAPTVRSKGATQSITATSAFSNGSADKKNTAQNVTTTISGQAVAPVNNVTATSAGLVRFSSAGTSTGTATVIVSNIGDGNKAGADNGTTFLSNLHGNLSSPTPGFSGSGGSINLKDNQSATFDYTFAPTSRGTVTASVAANLTSGSSDGKNTGQVVNATLTGQGVGPTYQSRLGTTESGAPSGAINTPAANTGSGLIDFGTLGTKSHSTLFLDIANISTDANGGNSTLTDLSLLSFSISGSQTSAFALGGSLPTVLRESGDHVVLPIEFNPLSFGNYAATLTFITDARVAFGSIGDTFSYTLSGQVTPAPEPATLLLFGVGLAGVVVARRQCLVTPPRQH